MATLNVATSIVDFLKSRGFQPAAGEPAPLFKTRKGIYESLGLTQKLGGFRGTAEQNPALLRALQKLEAERGQQISATNVFDLVRGVPPIPPVAPPAPPVQQPIQQPVQQPVQQPIQQPAQQFVQQPLSPSAQQVRAEIPGAGQPVPEFLTNLLAPPDIKGVAEQAVENITGQAETAIRKREADRLKKDLAANAEVQKKRAGQEAAAMGVAFSPIFFEAPQKAIDAQTISKQLGIDEDLALSVMKAARQEVAEIIKTGESRRKEALGILEDQGLTIDLTTGQLVPTLAARKQVEGETLAQQKIDIQEAQFAEKETRLAATQQAREEQFMVKESRFIEEQRLREQRFQEQQGLREAQLKLTEAKTAIQIQQAEDRIKQADERLKLTEARMGLQVQTQAEVQRRFEQSQAAIQQRFEQSQGAVESRYQRTQSALQQRATEKVEKPSPVDVRKEKEALVGYLGDVPKFRSREQALTELENDSTKIILEVGPSGFNTIKNEVDKRFPPTPATPPQAEKGPNIIQKAIKFIGGIFGL